MRKKEKDETHVYRNTNGKESEDAEELGGRSSRMSIIGYDGIGSVRALRNQCKNILLPSAAGTGKLAYRKSCCSVEHENLSENIEIFSGDV